MRIVCTSDLHGNLIDIPKCDLLLIAGDICPMLPVEMQYAWLDVAFRKWLNDIPAEVVVACAGNHDHVFEQWGDIVSEMKLRFRYLEDKSTTINGVKIYGTPWQQRFFDWSYNLDEAELSLKWQQIPSDTDILVCHSPPMFFGDLDNQQREHLGSPSLLERLMVVKPELVVCGHIHPGYGIYDHNGVKIVNASLVNDDYKLSNMPFLFDRSEGVLSRLTYV